MTARDPSRLPPSGTTTAEVTATLAELGTSVRDQFQRNRRVMSFAEYLTLVHAEPSRQLRSAATYLVDCLDHFGSSEVASPWGRVRRFHLFDSPWDGGEARVYGHEPVQNQLYRILRAFVRDGRPNRVVLLHGPNGSAKSTILRCLGRGLEHYSTLDDGALYRFSWILPSEKSSRGGLGFGGAAAPVDTAETFAYLPDESIDARLGDELRDHPLLLVPQLERQALLERLGPAGGGGDYLRTGTLSPKNRAIYEALLTSYQGDYLKVLRHVRVERFYVSQTYRTGWVTVEPQMSVDATERQVTADRSLAALPPSLQSLALYEYGGEVVGANRGLIEYDDLLKRPLEAFKYLLTTVERGALAMASATLCLDVVFAASANDIHVQAFRELPDFQSFKGRIELIRVPYILDLRHEQALYAARLREAAGDRHVAPHTAYALALWAVLTRMRKPQVERYPSTLAETIGTMTPLDKAELYAGAGAPSRLTPDKAKELLAQVEELWHESDNYPIFEGRVGASPREMQGVLLAAAGSTKYAYVSPQVVFDELAELLKQASLYEFLRQEAIAGGYHDHRQMIETTRQRVFDKVDEDVRVAVGFIDESEYGRSFERYVSHVMHGMRKEKVRNSQTGRLEDPDASMMREVEGALDIAEAQAASYRDGLMAKIGAWSIDHRGEKPVMTVIFADEVRRMRDAYFVKHKKQIVASLGELVRLLNGQEASLSAEARARAAQAFEVLVGRGYQLDSARDLVSTLAAQRYRA